MCGAPAVRGERAAVGCERPRRSNRGVIFGEFFGHAFTHNGEEKQPRTVAMAFVGAHPSKFCHPAPRHIRSGYVAPNTLLRSAVVSVVDCFAAGRPASGGQMMMISRTS